MSVLVGTYRVQEVNELRRRVRALELAVSMADEIVEMAIGCTDDPYNTQVIARETLERYQEYRRSL